MVVNADAMLAELVASCPDLQQEFAENYKLNDFAYALFDISADGSVGMADQGLEDGKQRNGSSSATVARYGLTALLLAITTSLLR